MPLPEMDWTRGRTVGRGSTATVSIATNNLSGQVFAVKSIELSKSEFLEREQRILSTLLCPQIVAYKGCDVSLEDGKLLYNLLLEYAPSGTLTDAICRGGLEEGRIRWYTRGVLLGLEYLHCNGIVHCDIKAPNILVTNDGAKIADLGCARRIDEVSNATWGLRNTPIIRGTPAYMAPEAARGEEQGFPADVWALGCVVLEMATGRAPWTDASDPVSTLYRIGFSSDEPEIPRFMSKQAKDFLSKCLKRKPAERWSASELLEHEFVKYQNSPPAQTQTHDLGTPTSVLNQGIWNSVERSETTWNSTQESCSYSAVQRIRQLSAGNSEAPSWAWGETWITVRGNGTSSKEPANCNLSSANEAPSGGGVNRTSDIPNPTDQFIIITSSTGTNACELSSKSKSNRRPKKCSLVTCKCTNDKLCTNLASRNKKFWFLILRALPFCFSGSTPSHVLRAIFYVPRPYLGSNSM